MKHRLQSKSPGRNINNPRYADNTVLMAESEELKSLLMKVKEEIETVGLNLNIWLNTQTQSVEEENTWSQGPGNKGREAGFTGAGAGKGVNLGAEDSAFICITRMHCPQYSVKLLFRFFFNFIIFFPFICISWRLIISQYCSGFCHTLT